MLRRWGEALGGWIDLVVGVAVVLCHTCCYILCCCCCCFNVVAGGLRLARVEAPQASALWPYILLFLLLLLLLLFKCSCCWWVGEGWGPAGSRLVASLPTRAGGRSNSWGLQATRSPPARCSIWKTFLVKNFQKRQNFKMCKLGDSLIGPPTALNWDQMKRIFYRQSSNAPDFWSLYTPPYGPLTLQYHNNIKTKLRND